MLAQPLSECESNSARLERLEYHRQYYLKNKEKMLKKIYENSASKWHCDVCDKMIRKGSKLYHLKSKLHQNALNGIKPKFITDGIKPETYYCETCKITIRKDSKRKHEKTKKHNSPRENS